MVGIGDTAFIEWSHVQPVLHAFCEDSCEDGIGMEGFAFLRQFLEEGSAPVRSRRVGTTKDVLMIFSWVFTERAPIRVARAVFVDKSPHGEHAVAEFDKVGTPLGIGGG